MITNILAAIDWNVIIAGALIGLSAGFGLYFLLLRGWSALCRRNEHYDREVIRRSQDCNLNDSASHPAIPHPRPAAVHAVVPAACEREAVGTSQKPAAAGSSLDLHAPGARQKIAAQLTKAAQFASSGDDERAHDLALIAVHELSCSLHERRADNAGVAR